MAQRPPDGTSRTSQGEGAMTDINAMVRNASRLNAPLPAGNNVPRFGDFTSSGDFHRTMNQHADAKSDFALLPSRVRAYFSNDVYNLIRAIEASAENPALRKRLESFGVLHRSEEPKAPPAPPAPTPTAPPEPLRPDPEAQPRRSS